MKRLLIPVLCLLAALLALPVGAQHPGTCYFLPGGVGITCLSGSTFTVAGAFDLNFASITADTSGLNLAATMNNGTASGTNVYGGIVTLTNNDADGDLFGLKITAAATANAAAGSYEYLLGLDCAENTAGACPDGVLITSTGASASLVDGLDVSDSDITYGVNTGVNPILGGNGETLTIGGSNNVFTLTTNSPGGPTLIAADDAGAADLTIDTTGAGKITIGSADVTAVDVITDGGTVTIDGVGITPSGITADPAAGTWTFSKTAAGGAVIIGADDAGAADTTLDTTGAGAITIGSADVTNVTVTSEDFTVGSSDDISVIAADDIEISGNSAGSIIGIGVNNDGNVINVGTDNSAKDAITIGSALDDVIIVSGAGAEAGTGVVAAERCLGGICQTVFTLTAVEVTITDPGGAAGYGSIKIYDFPAGWIYRLGTVASFSHILAGAGGIVDEWDGDVAFGSAADAGGGLAGTEVDFVASTTLDQAVAGDVTAELANSTATEQTILDGHSAAVDLYLTFNVDDADIAAGDTLTVTGSVTVTWVGLGDN